MTTDQATAIANSTSRKAGDPDATHSDIEMKTHQPVVDATKGNDPYFVAFDEQFDPTK